MLTGFLIALVLLLLITVSVLAVSNAKLWVKMTGLENSTHQIQFIDPLKAEFQNISKADAAKMGETDFNNIQ